MNVKLVDYKTFLVFFLCVNGPYNCLFLFQSLFLMYAQYEQKKEKGNKLTWPGVARKVKLKLALNAIYSVLRFFFLQNISQIFILIYVYPFVYIMYRYNRK
jgi:hypothetical protein